MEPHNQPQIRATGSGSLFLGTRFRLRSTIGEVVAAGKDKGEEAEDTYGPRLADGPRGHGERSRSQLLFQLRDAETQSILAVNVLAVNCPLPPL